MTNNKLAYLIWVAINMDEPNQIKASTQGKIEDVLDSHKLNKTGWVSVGFVIGILIKALFDFIFSLII